MGIGVIASLTPCSSTSGRAHRGGRGGDGRTGAKAMPRSAAALTSAQYRGSGPRGGEPADRRWPIMVTPRVFDCRPGARSPSWAPGSARHGEATTTSSSASNSPGGHRPIAEDVHLAAGQGDLAFGFFATAPPRCAGPAASRRSRWPELALAVSVIATVAPPSRLASAFSSIDHLPSDAVVWCEIALMSLNSMSLGRSSPATQARHDLREVRERYRQDPASCRSLSRSLFRSARSYRPWPRRTH